MLKNVVDMRIIDETLRTIFIHAAINFAIIANYVAIYEGYFISHVNQFFGQLYFIEKNFKIYILITHILSINVHISYLKNFRRGKRTITHKSNLYFLFLTSNIKRNSTLRQYRKYFERS